MKKKEQKKAKKKINISDKNHSALSDLDSQLGSFGLEPPKIYRKDQAVKEYNISSQDKNYSKHSADTKFIRRSGNSDRNNNKTTEQQRILQNKKRKKKNKLRKLIYILLIILAVAVAMVVLSLTVLFKIETITIKGNEIYSEKEITAVLPIEKEKNLFLTDLDGAAQKLEESLPYIYNAEVTRKLPSTIVVNITETQTVYSIKNKDKTYTLLDDNFKVLEASAAENPGDSIEIKKLALASANEGMTADISDEQVKKDLTALAAIIKELQLEDEITAIYSTDINNNYMVYDGRIIYKLGTAEDLENKVYSALAATEKLSETNPNAQGEMSVTGDKQVYFTEE